MTGRDTNRTDLLDRIAELERRLADLERLPRGYSWDPATGGITVPAGLDVTGAVDLASTLDVTGLLTAAAGLTVAAGAGTVLSTPGAATWGIGPTDGQDAYPGGLSSMHVASSDGWPGNGEILTLNEASVRFGQLFIEKNRGSLMFRGLVSNGPTLTEWRVVWPIATGMHRSATGTSIPNASWTQMAWPTVITDNGHTSFNRFVAPTDGWYSFATTVGWQNNTTNRRIVRILKGTAAGAAETNEIARAEARPGGDGKIVQSISGHDYLTAGTNVMVAVYQNSGATLSCGPHDCYSNFSAVRLSRDDAP